MTELVSLAEKGEAIQSLRQLTVLWSNVADEVFIETFRSEKYIRVQGQLSNAAMTYLIRRREIIELFSKINEIPTRCEVDEAHRNIYEQRKEVKALKKAVDEIQAVADSIPGKAEIPSRLELEQVQQSVEALRTEVRALQEALGELSAAKTSTKATARSKNTQCRSR